MKLDAAIKTETYRNGLEVTMIPYQPLIQAFRSPFSGLRPEYGSPHRALLAELPFLSSDPLGGSFFMGMPQGSMTTTYKGPQHGISAPRSCKSRPQWRWKARSVSIWLLGSFLRISRAWVSRRHHSRGHLAQGTSKIQQMSARFHRNHESLGPDWWRRPKCSLRQRQVRRIQTPRRWPEFHMWYRSAAMTLRTAGRRST